MSNLYFSPALITRLSLALSSGINAIQLGLEAAFDKIPSQALLEGGLAGFGTATGAVNAYILTVTPLSAVVYATGMQFTFLANLNNTGAATLNVNGLGVRSIVRIDGTALALNDLRAGQPYRVIYNGASFTLVSQSGAIAASGVVTYEYGTFNGVLSDGTNNATMSFSTCSYTKINQLVSVSGRITTTSLGSVTGAVRITGFPYAPLSPSLAGGAMAFCTGMNIVAGTTVTGFINSGSNFMLLQNFDISGGTSPLQATEWSATGDCRFSFSYITA